MTHIENIPHILEYGITHFDSFNANPNYRCIGDKSLINTRNSRTVAIDNGIYNPDNDNVFITLGDFIPFYFGIRMPMLYVVQNGGNFVEMATPPKNIVYLVCSVWKIIANCNSYYFTDEHATDMLTSY